MRMKNSVKIFLLWLTSIIAYGASTLFFPHRDTPMAALFNVFVQGLLFLICVFIVRKEPNRTNKFIFLNFLLLYGLSFVSLLYDFVGRAFLAGVPYISHFFGQYLTIAYAVLQAIAIIYLVIDLLFRDFRVYQKYIGTAIIVLFFGGYLFHQYLLNPLYLYSTENIKQWKTLDHYASQYQSEKGDLPSIATVSTNVTLQAWSDGVPVADLYPDANMRRIQELYPYLESENYLVLLWQPLYLDMIYMDVLFVGFILLYFGYQYKKDPPQGAYIDKIMFLLLLTSSMDILHNWGFIKSVEWGSMTQLFAIGQYITVFAEVMLVAFFALRLKFISSVQGEFYELELAANPRQVSRWRDWVDNMVLSHFFNLKVFNGRLFQGPSTKEDLGKATIKG